LSPAIAEVISECLRSLPTPWVPPDAMNGAPDEEVTLGKEKEDPMPATTPADIDLANRLYLKLWEIKRDAMGMTTRDTEAE
jgi:hypothetical protein